MSKCKRYQIPPPISDNGRTSHFNTPPPPVIIAMRQNTFQDYATPFSKLNTKEGLIEKLQTEVSELTQAKLDYNHSSQSFERLKKKYSEAQKEKERADMGVSQAFRTNQTNLKSTRIDLQTLSLSLKSRSSQLGEILSQKRCLEQNILQKEFEIEKLKARNEIDQQGDYLIQEQEGLLQQQHLGRSQGKQLEEDIYVTERKTRQVAKSVISKEAAVLALRLQMENKDRKLDLYERQNNALDSEIQEIVDREQRLLRGIGASEAQLQELEVLESTIKAEIRKEEAQLDDLLKRTKLFEKERNPNIRHSIKNKEVQLRRLTQFQQQQHLEINHLLKKNSQIVEINSRLKSDITFSQDHLVNVKRCNQLMLEYLERCKSDDRGLIEMMQKRVQGMGAVTQKTQAGVGKTMKRSFSRSTQNSWLEC